MSDTAAYALPVNDHTYLIEERIRFYQEVANRFFAAENWWGAFRAMSRVDKLCSQLHPSRNPLLAAAAQFIGAENLAHFRPERTPEPPPSVDLRTADLSGNTAEQNHAIYVEVLERLRAKAAEVGQPPISDREMFDWFRQRHGPRVAAGVGRIQAQLAMQAAPSG